MLNLFGARTHSPSEVAGTLVVLSEVLQLRVERVADMLLRSSDLPPSLDVLSEATISPRKRRRAARRGAAAGEAGARAGAAAQGVVVSRVTSHYSKLLLRPDALRERAQVLMELIGATPGQLAAILRNTPVLLARDSQQLRLKVQFLSR